MLVAKGLPGFIAYGVLVGEVVAPCLLITNSYPSGGAGAGVYDGRRG